MTLSKLSIRNAKRQAQDYLIYFATIILATALIYSFNGLIFSDELLKLSQFMTSLPIVIIFCSIAVVCIIGWLVYYTTNFMLIKRSRELGTYILIGLENQQVAKLFLLENLIIGGSALLFGLFFGNFLFQTLRAILLALFHMPYTFRFSFSLRAAGLTLLYFIGIYFFAQLKSRKKIYSMKIYDLIYFERQNELAVIQKSPYRRKIFFFSIVLGIIGIFLLLMRNLPSGLIGAVCIILFLYGFFLSFSSGIPAWFEKRPAKKYTGQNLLLFRTLSAKLATMGIVMATIALLFTGVLIAQGTGFILSALFQNRAEQTSCFDLFISSADPNTDFYDYFHYIQSNIPITDSREYQTYQGETSQITDLLSEVGKYFHSYPYDFLMKFSDYTALRTILGYPKVSLEPNTYLIHCMPYLKSKINTYSQPIKINNHTLTKGKTYTENFAQYLWNGNGQGFIIIVPDDLLLSRPISHTIYAAMTAEPISESQYYELSKIQDNRSEEYYDTLYAKAQSEREAASMTAIFVFPLYYLAFILTMTSATILTIQQLSECNHYRHQFCLLQKLGMEQKEMRQVLRQQFTIYYTMPAVPPLLIAIPFILNLGNATEPGTLTGISHPIIITAITLGLFFFIYSIYIIMAYTSLKQNVLPK